jgi:thiol-disulfide isomerase/thioredoxin
MRHPIPRGIAAILGICLAAIAGCGGSTELPAPTPPAHTPQTPQPAPSQAETPKQAAVALKPLSLKQYEGLVEQHRGKVLLVDFWATWCGPCVELLPHTAELSEKLRERGLDVVTVSLDEPDGVEGAQRLLAKHPGRLDNYLLAESGADETWNALAIKRGLPHLKLYDRSGKLRRTLDSEGLKPATIDAAIEELLSQPRTGQ